VRSPADPPPGAGGRAVVERAATLVAAGGAIIYPTDTFYALGVDPWNASAVGLLYRLKGRPDDKPVLLLIDDPSRAWRLWGEPHPAARRLAERFWPGPLTIVAPPGPGAPPLPAGLGLALRCPGHALAREILAATGPLTGTSANRAGGEPPRDAAAAAASFDAGIGLVVDGGTYRGDAASTVVVADARGVRVVRWGAIGREELMAAAGGFSLDMPETDP
jgi:L-threonylcarbamoyladenylate synthase